ncbi:alpha/beta hydrolase [Desulfovibrio sp. JY]|nr:alpha/beta hydrolase [Desulfovibrio sp. JY]
MKTQNTTMSRRGLMKLLGLTAASSIMAKPLRDIMTLMGLATATTTPIQAFAASKRIAKLFYTDTGKGRNMMLLHGWSCDSHDWSWQLPAFESRYRVVAIDLRGHGRSEVMQSGTYMPDDYVADIETLIETKFSSETFVLVGHSMGGQIAARLANKRPDLIEGVVSVDGSLGFSDKLAPTFQKAVDDLQRDNPADVGSALFAGFYDKATDPALKRWHARRLQGTPVYPVRESFGPLFFGPNQVGLGKQSEVFCKTISIPFYHLCRGKGQADRMRTWFSHPKSKVDLWEAAGHWIMQDRKDDVNASIITWVDML